MSYRLFFIKNKFIRVRADGTILPRCGAAAEWYYEIRDGAVWIRNLDRVVPMSEILDTVRFSEPLLVQRVDDTYLIVRFDSKYGGTCQSTAEKSTRRWEIVASKKKKDKFTCCTRETCFTFYRHEYPYLCSVVKKMPKLPRQKKIKD